jgi:S-adenosylmethionine:tRNA ribosyltransferase-isomerase
MSSPEELDLDAFDYLLPLERIAQEPAPERDGARLLLLDRDTGTRAHRQVRDLPALLDPGDLLVVNATRVLPARLRGEKTTGGSAEALILGEAAEPGVFRALVKTGKRQRVGLKFRFGDGDAALDAELVGIGEDGEVELAFADGASPYRVGEAPLPPYIRRPEARAEDAERYQTVFAREPGSVAAPTAGLHLSEAILDALAARGVERAEVVLHVGAGTFRPVGAEALRTRRLHAERFDLPEATAEAVRAARARGGRVVAVGTTTARVLETCAGPGGRIEARRGETELFLAPGDAFRVVDALLTNFHLPRSSLLLLVAAFAGRERVLDAYADAMESGYRFYSYGDAMLIR